MGDSHMSGVLLPLCVASLSLDLCCVDADVGRGEGREEEAGTLKPYVPLSETLLVMGRYVLVLGAG